MHKSVGLTLLNRPLQLRRLTVGLLVTLVLTGCAASNVATQGFSSLQPGDSVVLMPPDIKYFRVTASGIPEPAAEWTEQARAEFDNAFRQFAQDAGLNMAFPQVQEMSDVALEYDKLHSAVGSTILVNHYGMTKLPSKKDVATNEQTFDWSLGPGVKDLAPASDGKYALFVYFRDYQASGGRVGMAVFGALVGVAVYTGHQGGFASLVDLQTGDVVWFNNVPLAQGDMRSDDGAQKLVSQLFEELTATL